MTITVELARRMTEVDPKLRDVLFAMLDEMEHQRAQWETSVTKSEFNELTKVVRTLAEAQMRTELHVEELAKAQEKTEQRLDTLAQRIEELAEAQKRTEACFEALAEAQQKTEERLDALTARVDALTQRVEALAEAQQKTEERLAALTARVDALTQRVEALAEAQKRTEARIDELAQAMRDGFQRIHDSIAALGSRWGIQNEVVFRKTIETLLARQGITVTRGYYGHREVDVVIRNGEPLLLEITSQLRHSDLDKLLASCEDYIQREGVTPKLMVASNYVPPSVMRRILDSPRPIEIISYEEE